MWTLTHTHTHTGGDCGSYQWLPVLYNILINGCTVGANSHLSIWEVAVESVDQYSGKRVIDPFSVNQCRSQAHWAVHSASCFCVREPFNLIGHYTPVIIPHGPRLIYGSPACLSLPFHYSMPVSISKLIKENESNGGSPRVAEKYNLINVCGAAALGTSFMLFTGCYVFGDEGTSIWKAFSKGKQWRCI